MAGMLYLPTCENAVMPIKNRPALISVMHGTPRRFSLRSMLKAPEVPGATVSIAHRQTSTRRGSATVLASEDRDDTPLGLFSPPKYDSLSNVLARTSDPAFQRLWQRKSRPGRYSERVNEEAGTSRISSQ